MSQAQEFSPSFSLVYDQDIEQGIFEELGSQGIGLLSNSDLTDGPYANDICDSDISLQDENLEDVKFYTFPQLRPSLTNEVLSNDEYSGPHEFEVAVLPNYHSRNPWVYSTILNKVFMDINQQFPVDFKIKNRPNKTLYIRITPQYTAQHHAGEAVIRCIQHDHHGDSTNKDVDENVRKHVIRCSNKFSQYIGEHQRNERLSIVFPLSSPQVGSESVRELFQFVCKSSCPSPGMNRRCIEIIFTLEDEEGVVLGRNCLKVRVCACPKRDKEKEENECNKNVNPAPRGKKRKAPPPANPGKVLSQPDDYTVYDIKVCGRQNLLDVFGYMEKVYTTRAYHLQGQPGENIMKRALLDIQEAKRKLQ